METGASEPIAGADVPFADGIEFDGQRLYVVQNYWDQISRFKLSPDLSHATLEEEMVHPDYDVPTAVALIGDRLAAVNSHFDPLGQLRGTRFEVIVTDS